MKTEKLFIALVTALLLGACGNQTVHYTVTGNVNDVLSRYNGNVTADSVFIAYGDYILSGRTAVNPNGAFRLSGSIDGPLKKSIMKCELETNLIIQLTVDGKTEYWSQILVLEDGNIIVNNLQQGNIQGTPLNDAMYNELCYLKETTDSPQAKLQRITAFIQQHKQTLVPAALIQNIGIQQLLTDEELISIIDNTHQELTPGSFIQLYSSGLKGGVERRKRLSGKGEGDMYTDFEVEYKGKVQRLSDYAGRGQYVLMYFWSSRGNRNNGRGIPEIAKLHKQYKDKGLIVLGIDSNTDPEDAEKAAKELGIPYPQIINGGRVPSESCGIAGIPSIIFLGPDGTILKRGAHEEETLQAIRKYLEQ